jgi:hypothetical protein
MVEASAVARLSGGGRNSTANHAGFGIVGTGASGLLAVPLACPLVPAPRFLGCRRVPSDTVRDAPRMSQGIRTSRAGKGPIAPEITLSTGLAQTGRTGDLVNE